MPQYYAKTVYTETGAGETVFSLDFTYSAQEDVIVEINGVETTNYSWSSPSTISLNTGTTAGDTVTLYRKTSLTQRAVDFQNAAELTEKDLDDSAQQVFNATQEAYDIVIDSFAPQPDGSLDLGGRVLGGMAEPVATTDAANKSYVDAKLPTNEALRTETQGYRDQAVTSASNAAISEANAASSEASAAASLASLTGTATTDYQTLSATKEADLTALADTKTTAYQNLATTKEADLSAAATTHLDTMATAKDGHLVVMGGYVTDAENHADNAAIEFGKCETLVNQFDAQALLPAIPGNAGKYLGVNNSGNTEWKDVDATTLGGVPASSYALIASTDTSAEVDAKVAAVDARVDTVESNVSANTTALASKATTAALALTDADVAALTTTVNGKAAQTSLDTTNSDVAALTTTVNGKASQSSVDSLSSSLSGKANTSGTYASLRAQATTKDDVGLGNVGNYGRSNSTTSSSTSTYATSNAVYNTARYLPKSASYNGVGQLAFLSHKTLGTAINPNSTYSGSSLAYAGINAGDTGGYAWGGGTGGSSPSGTWRALGMVIGRFDRQSTTLFVRIS